ncbi:hypothetical protein [Isorropodon fossajaponicum symbiont]|uniref:DprA-like winged helix domain-containing protein n=1 Tax=Isorropodon fossajaponicum symbiont TaxID=883811 RepID=UPI001915548A|nr:hypothetical protein [Isorropodon fossajaponicum symbiont]
MHRFLYPYLKNATIPSSIHNPLSKGYHQLIKQGSKLTDNIEDILSELPKGLGLSVLLKKEATYAKNVDKTDAMLLKCLSYNAVTVDKLVEKTNLSPQIITQALLLLELENKVAKMTGSGYVLTK